MRHGAAALVLLHLFAAPATAETLVGPVPAVVERVIDGDTLAVRARVWLGQDVHVLVRIRGIDTPEIRGRCVEEQRLARVAARQVAEAVSEGPVTLSHIEGGKYHGRVLADVELSDGRDLAATMLRAGNARPYEGSARRPWCAG